MKEQLSLTDTAKTNAERMLELARDLGSEGNIDAATGALVFTTEEDADNFKGLANEQGFGVRIVKEPPKETGGTPTFRVTAEEQEVRAGMIAPEPSAPREATPESSPETVKEQFERVLKGKFASVVKGTFETPRAPFTSATIIPAESGGKTSINATLFYKTTDGRDTHATWSLFEDGVLSGRIPKDLSLAREAILREVLSTVEAMNPKQWYGTALEIIPDRDKGEERDLPRGEGEGGRRERPNDPERLRALERLPGFALGFVNKERGFDGYRGAVVTGKKGSAIVLDCEWVGNASFVVPLTTRIETKRELITPQKVEQILSTVWAPIAHAARTRKELMSTVPETERFVHAGEWQKKIREAVERLSG